MVRNKELKEPWVALDGGIMVWIILLKGDKAWEWETGKTEDRYPRLD